MYAIRSFMLCAVFDCSGYRDVSIDNGARRKCELVRGGMFAGGLVASTASPRGCRSGCSPIPTAGAAIARSGSVASGRTLGFRNGDARRRLGRAAETGVPPETLHFQRLVAYAPDVLVLAPRWSNIDRSLAEVTINLITSHHISPTLNTIMCAQ